MALMLEEVKPQVVHILTQPDSHFALASMAIKAGAHVVVEKPVTANAQEARDLVEPDPLEPELAARLRGRLHRYAQAQPRYLNPIRNRRSRRAVRGW